MLEWTRKSDYVPHPPGEWRAQFVEWAEEKHEQYGIQAKLQFDTEVLDDDNRQRRVTIWSKPSLHPKGKICKMLAAMGFNPDAITDEELKTFSLNQFIGRRLRLVIVNEPKKNSKDEIQDKVTGFLPWDKQAVRTGGAFAETPEASQPTPALAGVGADTAAPKSPFGDDD